MYRPKTLKELLYCVMLDANICDHMGDMGRTLENISRKLNIPYPPTDDDGFPQSTWLEAQGAKHPYEWDEG